MAVLIYHRLFIELWKKNRHVSHTLWILRFRHRKWEHFFLVSFYCQDFGTRVEFHYVLSRWPLPYTFSRISDCISHYKIPAIKKIINKSLRNKLPILHRTPKMFITHNIPSGNDKKPGRIVRIRWHRSR